MQIKFFFLSSRLILYSFISVFVFNLTFLETCYPLERKFIFPNENKKKKKRKKNLFYCSFVIINFSILDFIRNLSP